MTEQKTHLSTDANLCGQVAHLEPGKATVTLTPTADMSVDHHHLIHGGFVFGLADYAAMLAINHPNVVLGAANVRFTKPVVQGQELRAEASLVKKEGKKLMVQVTVSHNACPVFEGEFTCFTLQQHVLSPQ